MGVALTWCAAACALIPSLLGAESLAALDARSRLAFAAVPWLLLAGLPRRVPLSAGFALGLALPTVALAGWLDARSGFAASELWQRAIWSFLCAGLLHHAARRARGATLHGAAWFVLSLALPGLGALATAFGEGGGRPFEWAQALGAAARSIAVAGDLRVVPLDAAALVAACVLSLFGPPAGER